VSDAPILYTKTVYVYTNLLALKTEVAIADKIGVAPEVSYHDSKGRRYRDGYAKWVFENITLAQWAEAMAIGDENMVDLELTEPPLGRSPGGSD
jgi:hypothetical protein